MPSATSTETLAEKTSKLSLNKTIVKDENKYSTVGTYKANKFATRVLGDDGILRLTDEEAADIKYPDYAPTWDTNEHGEPYQEFEFHDRGLDADPSLKNLFPTDGSFSKEELTPKFGTEVKGIQLSQLSNSAKDELALFVAQRGVVVFRDQDLAAKGPKFNHEFGEYFGPLHIHPASGAPEGYSTLHLVYRSTEVKPNEAILKNHGSTVAFHSDVSYEKQPPSITFLAHLEGPTSGGDTVFVDSVTAYERLSPQFQQIIERLHAVHSGFEQAENSRKNGGITRREPVANVHPVVRTNQLTGKKAIYVNRQFTRDIVDLKKEESDAILNFLYDHLFSSIDLHVRVKWEENTVVVWDNRITSHTALLDWDTPLRRHLYRLASRAEVPYLEKQK
ncbi:hypothetical protein WICMUC_002869 [Wickerhamomyces mucosus]|uniref:TauD/TfdA-like domain-containing protein n=1 Tax=Wickerhamomyces mucosus TaxID=1378264 RepID=A0A9P8PNA9_9ASCO|nr:hypothetical protein WICMUC_002869 [Wickerhamomyces mucosus]